MQEHRYTLTRSSGNRKLGGIPVTTSSRSTCPDNCSLKKNGCYADQFPLVLHWDRVSDGRRGVDLETLCEQIKALPKFSLWRYAQAGDLPGDGIKLDPVGLASLALANKGRNGFAYTHYSPRLKHNRQGIQFANDRGFTVNMSAETLEQADQYADLNIGPVVTLLPHDQVENTVTPAGRPVVVCPASKGETNCSLCAICAKPDRKAIVGFPAHGSSKAKVNKVFFATVSH